MCQHTHTYHPPSHHPPATTQHTTKHPRQTVARHTKQNPQQASLHQTLPIPHTAASTAHETPHSEPRHTKQNPKQASLHLTLPIPPTAASTAHETPHSEPTPLFPSTEPFTVQGHNNRHNPQHTETIGALNTMGWKHCSKGDKWIPKTKSIASLMRAEDIHILGITALDWKSEDDMNQFMAQLPPDFIGIGAQGFEPDRPQSVTGVGIIIQNNPNHPIEISHIKRCPTGRWLSVRINRTDQASIRVMVIYGPAGNKPNTTKPRTQLCEDIHKWRTLQTDYMAATDKFYLLGDFNATLHGTKTKDLQFQTVTTSKLKAFNTLQHGHTFFGSGHHTLIDYITGNNIATDMHCKTEVLKVPEIQTDHKLVKTTTQTTTTLRNSRKQYVHVTQKYVKSSCIVRAPKMYGTGHSSMCSNSSEQQLKRANLQSGNPIYKQQEKNT